VLYKKILIAISSLLVASSQQDQQSSGNRFPTHNMLVLGRNVPPPQTRFPLLSSTSSTEAVLRPPGHTSDDDEPSAGTPQFDAGPLPVFNNSAANNIPDVTNKTLTYLWCVGESCELAVDEQLEILQEAVRYIGKSCLTGVEVQLHTFSRNRSSMVYQDNPVYVVM
jgi:hypothetical protein